MLKIKFLILLSSVLYLISCEMRIEESLDYENSKYSLKYLSGGQSAFNFTNILRQQLIVNNLYSDFAKKEIAISLIEDGEILSTSITKVATRESNTLLITVRVYDENKSGCVIFNEDYMSKQSFLVSESSATLSNRAAQEDIFLINSENISHRIVDDLLFLADVVCNTNE